MATGLGIRILAAKRIISTDSIKTAKVSWGDGYVPGICGVKTFPNMNVFSAKDELDADGLDAFHSIRNWLARRVMKGYA
jgi:hypothetical protein